MFIDKIHNKAKENKKIIVLPESEDQRVIQATKYILQNDLANIILLAKENDKSIWEKLCDSNCSEKNPCKCCSNIKIIDNTTSEYLPEFAKIYYELRKHKGVSLEQATNKVQEKSYFGTLLVHCGYADGFVSGATHTTANTIRPAFEIIKTAPNTSIVSSAYFMCLPDGKVFVFSDCAVNPNPTPEQLAQIAFSSAITAKKYDIEPKVALISYSTGTSGKGPSVDAVNQAKGFLTELALKNKGNIDFDFDGPMQFDAAMIQEIGKRKMPDSLVAGNANTLIFPDLNTGNAVCKAVQIYGKAIAVGPVLQGLNKPVNDLSRGASVDDIINTVVITAIQAQE